MTAFALLLQRNAFAAKLLHQPYMGHGQFRAPKFTVSLSATVSQEGPYKVVPEMSEKKNETFQICYRMTNSSTDHDYITIVSKETVPNVSKHIYVFK